MPMRNMSKTDSGCGASCAATSPETIAAGVGRDGSYVVTDAPRATGRRSMGTIVQQPPGALPVVAVVPPDLRRCSARQISGRRVACLNGPGHCVCRWAAARPRDRHTRASLGVVDLEARPGPAATHRHRGQAPQVPRRPPIGCACVSWSCRRPPAPRPGPAGPAAAFLLVVLVAPLVFRAPEGPAAREARRPHFVRRRASKPARALRSLRRPPYRRRLRCCVVSARPRGGLREVPPWHVLSNFARNSPEGVSGFEIRSLIFRGFRAVGEWGHGGITCDFGVGRECGWGSVWGVVGERL